MTCPLLNKLVENRRGVALAFREKGVAHSPNPEISPKTFGVGTNHLNGLSFQITPLGSNYMMQVWWMHPALLTWEIFEFYFLAELGLHTQFSIFIPTEFGGMSIHWVGEFS